MKLFLVHCGYYDPEVGDGVYELHTNFFVVAEDFSDAKAKAKQNEGFKKKRMHVDGLQTVDAVDGFRIEMKLDPALEGRSELPNQRYRELSAKPASTTTH